MGVWGGAEAFSPLVLLVIIEFEPREKFGDVGGDGRLWGPVGGEGSVVWNFLLKHQ